MARAKLHLYYKQPFTYANFHCFQSKCEIIIESPINDEVKLLCSRAITLADEIQNNYNPKLDSSELSKINASSGNTYMVANTETAKILDYCNNLFYLTDGLFDVSIGSLMQVWSKTKQERIKPSLMAINKAIKNVGWQKVIWNKPSITTPKGMALDVSSFIKAYAVDKIVDKLKAKTKLPALINFSGDMRVLNPTTSIPNWSVSIAGYKDNNSNMPLDIYLKEGAIATSGSAINFLDEQNRPVYSGVNPLTGDRIRHSPDSIVVQSDLCVQASTQATIAMLKGRMATAYLQREKVKYWVRF